MSITDPLSDLLTRVRNAQSATKTAVSMPSSKAKLSLCEVLKQEGYISGYHATADSVKPVLTIELKYFNGLPVIESIQRISSPGRRVYKSAKELPAVLGGFGIAIVSTSRGLMTDKSARKSGLGGEVICTVS